jgi:hypothetical protein
MSRPDDGGSKDLRNVGKLLPDYTAIQPRIQPSLYSPTWESQVLPRIFLFATASRPALGSTQPPLQWVLGFTSGVKRPGRQANHLLPSSVEVKNTWNFTSLRHTSAWWCKEKHCVQLLPFPVPLQLIQSRQLSSKSRDGSDSVKSSKFGLMWWTAYRRFWWLTSARKGFPAT